MLKNAALLASTLLLLPAPLIAQHEIVAAIQVHGNTISATETIIEASGIKLGEPVSDRMLSDAEARLRKVMRFESVDVLRRFASISDPTQVLVLIQVDEGPVRVEVPKLEVPMPGLPAPSTGRVAVVRRSRFNVMFVPILGAEDGYGFTYGAQFAFSGHRSTRRRVVVPVSWGGDKRLAAEYQQEFSARAAPRVRAGGMFQRRTHPFFDENADRRRIWGRAEWSLLRDLRAGVEGAWESTTLAAEEVDARSIGGDIVFDTRVDPLMPHNAVFVRAAADRLHFSTTRNAVRSEVDANAYLGVYRGTIVALRTVSERFNQPAPLFYKSILGGSRNLRGFRAGQAVGDQLLAGSIELRIPTTSPLRMARFGVNVFMDAGTTYDVGQRLRDRKLEKGVGAGIWATAPLFRFSVAVARGLGSGWRAHIGAGLTL